MAEDLERYSAIDRQFIAPTSYQDAEQRLNEVTAKIVQIQGELSQKRRYYPDGTMMDIDTYWEWHRKAKYAWVMSLSAQRALKLWLKDHEELRPLPAERPGDWTLRTLNRVAVAARRYVEAVQAEELGETPLPSVDSCFAVLEVAVAELPTRPASAEVLA